MATKEDKWFVGQLPVSSAYVGETQVYPSGDGGGEFGPALTWYGGNSGFAGQCNKPSSTLMAFYHKDMNGTIAWNKPNSNFFFKGETYEFSYNYNGVPQTTRVVCEKTDGSTTTQFIYYFGEFDPNYPRWGDANTFYNGIKTTPYLSIRQVLG